MSASCLQLMLIKLCTVQAKSYLGAKHDFEIWDFNFFLQELLPDLNMKAQKCAPFNNTLKRNPFIDKVN